VYEEKHKAITDFINWIYEEGRQQVRYLQGDEELHIL
jgi:ABC-type phosphate transport system substrate-binding protein